MANFDQIPEQALAWLKAGKTVGLATVVKTWGSAPRPVGAQMAINADMEMAGSVSGGCVEAAVVEEMLGVFASKKPLILSYGVSDEDAFAVGMACGGEIRIMLEAIDAAGMAPALLEKLVMHRANRQPVAYLVDLEKGIRSVCLPVQNDAELTQRFAADKSGFAGDVFINIHNPPLRMIIVGAAHIAQPLVQMAKLANYDVVLVDPRGAFATPARFPDTRLVHDWPDVALANEGLDGRVAVVTLSHDPKIDDPAIKTALGSDVFYLGCLGSTRTHAKRADRLAKAGYAPNQIARIHAPVGIDIGAKTPAEIAVSIMAEITERLQRPETRRS